MGLFDSRHIDRKSLKIYLSFITGTDPSNVSMSDIELSAVRIVTALDAAKTKDFMLRLYIPEALDSSNYRQKICEKFHRTHLAQTTEKDTDDEYGLIISNRECKINGYGNFL